MVERTFYSKSMFLKMYLSQQCRFFNKLYAWHKIAFTYSQTVARYAKYYFLAENKNLLHLFELIIMKFLELNSCPYRGWTTRNKYDVTI